MSSSPQTARPSRLRRLFASEERGTTSEQLELERGRLALTLVREFEAQGAGWFWRTGRDGEISYLSDKVVVSIAHGDAVADATRNAMTRAGKAIED